MSFGLNRAEVIGRLGADVTVNHLVSGGAGGQPQHRHQRVVFQQVSCFMMHLVGTVRSNRQIWWSWRSLALHMVQAKSSHIVPFPPIPGQASDRSWSEAREG